MNEKFVFTSTTKFFLILKFFLNSFQC
jgi:hypothetical protein